MPNRNELVIRGARNAMEQFKVEVANEIGLRDYDKMDKGWLSSRQNGYVGGNMVRRMISFAEQVIDQQGYETVRNTRATLDVPQTVKRLNEMASTNFQSYIQALQSGTIQRQALMNGGESVYDTTIELNDKPH